VVDRASAVPLTPARVDAVGVRDHELDPAVGRNRIDDGCVEVAGEQHVRRAGLPRHPSDRRRINAVLDMPCLPRQPVDLCEVHAALVGQ
jgi:hypothetical protein